MINLAPVPSAFSLQSIFSFQLIGKEVVNDFMADKWQKINKVDKKVNEYTMYLRWKVSNFKTLIALHTIHWYSRTPITQTPFIRTANYLYRFEK